MKILVVSDTHRRNEVFLKLIKKLKPLDLLIHCGDAEGSEYLISRAADCQTQFVMGNNDFYSSLPQEIELTLEGHKIWVTHGHYYGVNMGNDRVKREGKARGAEVVIYGHTHKPLIDFSDKDIIAINPGSLSYPRQENHRPSYLLMEIDEGGEMHFTIGFV
jgi:putative phosphoesterase